MQAVEGNREAQRAAGVSGRGRIAGRRLSIVEGLEEERGGDGRQCRQKEKRLRRLVHRGAPCISGMDKRLEDWTAKAGKSSRRSIRVARGMPPAGSSFQGLGETGDRQDWQRNSGKLRRKFMPVLSVPVAYNLDMRVAFSLGILAVSLSAQSFDPKMPPAVPPAVGAVVESAPLRYIDVQVGTGAAAKPGQEYTVHYTGWLRDGTKFDSSVAGGKPLQFVQGRRQVIAGWEMGFEGMKVGGKRRLFLPYALAYGENGRGKIPPKAELIFDVELLGVKDMPPLVATAGLLLPFEELEKQVLALAKSIPE